MQMFEVREKEAVFGKSMISYHRTLEEAQARVAGSTRGTRERQDIPGHEYLEIVVIERESLPCSVCGGERENPVESTYTYCRSCHYTGAASEHIRADQMLYFRTQLPEAEIGIEHTGGGCMWLAFHFPDLPGREFLAATDGEASLPSEHNEETDEWEAIRGGWGYCGVQYDCIDPCPNDSSCCGAGEGPTLFWVDYPEDGSDRDPDSLISDEELVKVIKQWHEQKLAAA